MLGHLQACVLDYLRKNEGSVAEIVEYLGSRGFLVSQDGFSHLVGRMGGLVSASWTGKGFGKKRKYRITAGGLQALQEVLEFYAGMIPSRQNGLEARVPRAAEGRTSERTIEPCYD